MMHDRTGYPPHAVLRRGEVIVSECALHAKPGSGEFLPRGGADAATPLSARTAGAAHVETAKTMPICI